MGKRLALFFDGTWNTPEDSTRVHAAHTLTAENSNQKKVYFRGLGTSKGQAFTGGIFAKGLGENVREGYQWLVDTYEDGDEVFIFGFSRGSFTATSVLGMIMRFGLLRSGATLTTDEIFNRYEKWDKHPRLYALRFDQNNGQTDFSEEDQALLDQSRRIKIKMLGIWDSVATIGFPIGNISRFSRNALKFHNPRPSSLYENVFHALAVDEHRKGFRPTLFHDYIHHTETTEQILESRAKLETRIEQRWFCGVHGDVGGGDNVQVSNAPYGWILSHAKDLGLELNGAIPVTLNLPSVPINDSYKKFLKGLYPILRLGRRYQRKIGARPKRKKEDLIEPIHETIDKSVFERWKVDPNYRPKNLKKFFRDESRINTQVGNYKILPQDRH